MDMNFFFIISGNISIKTKTFTSFGIPSGLEPSKVKKHNPKPQTK